jgi:hypothetical protein
MARTTNYLTKSMARTRIFTIHSELEAITRRQTSVPCLLVNCHGALLILLIISKFLNQMRSQLSRVSLRVMKKGCV